MFRRAALLGVLAVVVTCSLAGVQGGELLRHSYLGKVPPELVSEKEHWFGAAQPVTLANFQGKVIWLQFNF